MPAMKSGHRDKKETDGKYVSAGVGVFPKIEACYDCGLPIVKFLKKHNIIKKEDKKNKVKEV